jgi:hypothetical protein
MKTTYQVPDNDFLCITPGSKSEKTALVQRFLCATLLQKTPILIHSIQLNRSHLKALLLMMALA